MLINIVYAYKKLQMIYIYFIIKTLFNESLLQLSFTFIIL